VYTRPVVTVFSFTCNNVLYTEHLKAPAEWIKEYRKTGIQTELKLNLDTDSPIGLIDPADVGVVGALLLTQDDPGQHNHAKYILNGPEDVTGQRILELVTQVAGVEVEHVTYKSTASIEEAGQAYGLPPKIVNSWKLAVASYWKTEPSLSASATSKAVLELAPPSTKIETTLEVMLAEGSQ
jgi:uncharacterized protein YbjT (DUF2867 family)